MGADAEKIERLGQATTNELLNGMKQLESRVVGFNRATVAGKTMLGLVASVAIGVNFCDSYQAMTEKPDGVKFARTVVLSALGVHRLCGLLVALGVDPASPVGRYAALKLGEIPGLGRLISTKLAGVPIGEIYLQIYAFLEAGNAVRSAFGWGVPQDSVQAGISGASGTGLGLAFSVPTARRNGRVRWES